MFVLITVTVCGVLFPLLYDMFLPQDAEIQNQAARTFRTLVTKALPFTLITVILIFLHQIKVIHRILGPLENFKNTFIRVADGDLTRKVILRHGDYLEDESAKINRMIQSLSNHEAQLQEGRKEIIPILREIKTKIQDEKVSRDVDRALEIATDTLVPLELRKQ
jgi:methyl-accepting chemotaxis protein